VLCTICCFGETELEDGPCLSHIRPGVVKYRKYGFSPVTAETCALRRGPPILLSQPRPAAQAPPNSFTRPPIGNPAVLEKCFKNGGAAFSTCMGPAGPCPGRLDKISSIMTKGQRFAFVPKIGRWSKIHPASSHGSDRIFARRIANDEAKTSQTNLSPLFNPLGQSRSPARPAPGSASQCPYGDHQFLIRRKRRRTPWNFSCCEPARWDTLRHALRASRSREFCRCVVACKTCPRTTPLENDTYLEQRA